MVFNQKDMQTEIIEQLHGGNGATELRHIIPPDKLPANAPFFSIATLKPGCSIAQHKHLTESEVYYVLSGRGVIHDNGRKVPVYAGDSHMCSKGNEHGIENDNDEPLVLVVVIILD